MDNWKNIFSKENRYYETDNGILYNNNDINILNKFPDESINLIITSPPYDNLRDYNTNIDKIWNFDIFKEIAFQLSRILIKGGIIVWIVGDATINGSETGTSFKQALFFKEKCNLNLHDTMIYEKNSFNIPSQTRYHQIFEYMFIFSKGKPKVFNPIKDRKNKYANTTSWGKSTIRQSNGKLIEKKPVMIKEFGMRYNIWKYNTGYNFSTKDNFAYKHPAIFPEKLAYDHIISWSNKNDIILDPFIGSGTTAKESIKLNRRWIGIEINREYCEIVKKRIQNVQQQLL